MPDFGDFFSAVTGGPSTPGRATFDIRWLGGGARTTVRDDDNGFIETLVQGTAVIEWSASNAEGYAYRTTSSADQTTVTAAVGHERNGIFARPRPAAGTTLSRPALHG